MSLMLCVCDEGGNVVGLSVTELHDMVLATPPPLPELSKAIVMFLVLPIIGIVQDSVPTSSDTSPVDPFLYGS